jgi:hypothetical protein
MVQASVPMRVGLRHLRVRAATPNNGAGHASTPDTKVLEIMRAVAGGALDPEDAAKKMMTSNGAGVREVHLMYTRTCNVQLYGKSILQYSLCSPPGLERPMNGS